MNGGNQMVALNLRCHTDGGHWLCATKALQLFRRQTKFTMVKIFSEDSIQNGLKLFLEQPKWTMGWNIFWRLNSQWVEMVLKQPKFTMGWNLYYRLNLQWVEIVSDTTQIWNGLKSLLDAQRFTKLIQVVPSSEIWFLHATGLLKHQIFQENENMNFRQYSGLFGIYGLEGQNKGITPILNASWFEFGPTIIKIHFLLVLPLGVAFKTFFGLFKFYWKPWCQWYAKILFLSRTSPLNISEPNIPFQFTVCLLAHHLAFPIVENLCNTLKKPDRSKVHCHLMSWFFRLTDITGNPPLKASDKLFCLCTLRNTP